MPKYYIEFGETYTVNVCRGFVVEAENKEAADTEVWNEHYSKLEGCGNQRGPEESFYKKYAAEYEEQEVYEFIELEDQDNRTAAEVGKAIRERR